MPGLQYWLKICRMCGWDHDWQRCWELKSELMWNKPVHTRLVGESVITYKVLLPASGPGLGCSMEEMITARPERLLVTHILASYRDGRARISDYE